MTEKQVNRNGIDYYTLVERPQSNGRPAQLVLLCHALMSNLQMYDYTDQALNDAGYPTIRFDHIGHNNTPAPPDENASFHMDDLTRHMHQLVQATTSQKHLHAMIGCSIGGVLALIYAMMYPQDVEKVISIAAPGIANPEASKVPWSQRIEHFEGNVRTGGDGLCRATVNRWVKMILCVRRR